MSAHCLEENVRKLNALLDYFQFVLRRFTGGTMSHPGAQPKDIDAEAARALLSKKRPDALTILDVRQQWEYEEFHLPGATLLPLAELEDRAGEIPRDKPLLVYCHSGRRSSAAASLLASQGHPDVSNMVGGVMAWKGATAVGAPGVGMQHYRGDETPDEILAIAFAMERELGAFYLGLASSNPDPELAATFTKLAGFEDKHKLVVFHLYKTLYPQAASIEELAGKATATALEGGRSAEEIMAGAKPFESARNALDMAMGIEAQALDLYTRLAAVAANPQAGETLRELAGEERGHLRALSTMMDRLGAEKS